MVPPNNSNEGEDEREASSSNNNDIGLPLEILNADQEARRRENDGENDKQNDSSTKQTGRPLPHLAPRISQAIADARSSGRQGSNDQAKEQSLEERVQELETKLAVLSRLMQKQKGTPRHVLNTTPPASTDNLSPPRNDVWKQQQEEQQQPPRTPPLAPELIDSPTASHVSLSRVPHLESPAPISKRMNEFEDDNAAGDDHSVDTVMASNETHSLPKRRGQRRNLSFSLLYGGNEVEYNQRNDSAPPTSSMTAAERRWLRPKILQFQQQQQEQAKTNVPDDTVRSKWLNYLNSFQESTPDVDVQMEEFVKVPGQMENIMNFGFFICVDSFLYMITVLPIRFVWSCFLLAIKLLLWKNPSPPYQFHRRHVYQMIQVMILLFIYQFVLMNISIGKLYHWIRGQAMIKLYVLIAIVEVFDRLMSSLGQDCLDSMYWNTTSRPRSWRFVISIMVVLAYATVHSLFLFVHVETLNVAMNSADQALLTLLISGNFAEIKSTVFKKYNKPALFKITASDICERFKLGLFLSLVLLLNLSQGMEEAQLFDYLRICGFVWCAEVLSDSIKHSFITKFNFLPAKVYPEYALLLAGDVTGIGHEGVNLDHSHAVVKRIGFAQIPLVCVMFRLLRGAYKYATLNHYFITHLSRVAMWSLTIGLWLGLLAVKLALGSLLQRISLAKLRTAPEVSNTPVGRKKNKSV